MKAVIRSFRVPFLVLTPVCVGLGVVAAWLTGAAIHWGDALVALGGALCAHMSVNAFNEYFDFRSGLDAQTQRTPFSGGSGSLVERPAAAVSVLNSALLTLAVTVLAGGYVILRHGWGILPIGLLGVVIILTYTHWINRLPWVCLVAPGVAFGPLMVMGTQYALAGEFTSLAALISLVPFFLVNNLLLLNQYPDRDADAAVGRRHIPIALGLSASNALYGGFLLAAALTVGLGVAGDRLPVLALLALVPMLAAVFTLWGAIRYANDIPRLIPFMGANVLAVVTAPLVLAVALVVG